MVASEPPTIVALIPARSGSKRVPDKNILPLAGHPLLAYTIQAARQSEIFSGWWFLPIPGAMPRSPGTTARGALAAAPELAGIFRRTSTGWSIP